MRSLALCLMICVTACTAVQETPSSSRNLGELHLASEINLSEQLSALGLDQKDAALQLYHAGNAVIFSDYLEHGATGMFELPSQAALQSLIGLKPGAQVIIEGRLALGLSPDAADFLHVHYKGMFVVLHVDRMTTGKFVESADEYGVMQRRLDLATLRAGTVSFLDREGRILSFRPRDLEEVARARSQDLPYRVIPQSNPLVVFETPKGEVRVELLEDEAPNTVAAFLDAIHKGDWNHQTSFYRVCPYSREEGGEHLAIAQAGDPRRGAALKIDVEQTMRPHVRGTLAMLASGGSADPLHVFFNLESKVIESWQGVYPIFGKVYDEGRAFDLDAIRQGEFVPKDDRGLGLLDEIRPGDSVSLRVVRQRRVRYRPRWSQE